jgi:hypothetical protein
VVTACLGAFDAPRAGHLTPLNRLELSVAPWLFRPCREASPPRRRGPDCRNRDSRLLGDAIPLGRRTLRVVDVRDNADQPPVLWEAR